MQSGEKSQPHGLEKQSYERVGHWAERLLVAAINRSNSATAEQSTEDEDRYGIDMWITVTGRKEPIPVNLTLATGPDIEEKRRRASEIGYVVFEATPAGISVSDLEAAAHGGINFQKKVLKALYQAIEDQEEQLRKIGKSFITRRELDKMIAADDKAQNLRHTHTTQRNPYRSHCRY